MVAFTVANANADIPKEVCDALQDALEVAIANVPAIQGRVYVCPDVSGSMSSPVTGFRKGATTAVRCIDVAALVAAAETKDVSRVIRILDRGLAAVPAAPVGSDGDQSPGAPGRPAR